MNPSIEIAGRSIGPGQPVFIVAELSGNHGQRLDDALALIRAAAESGADAVKIQTYTPDTMTLDCDAPVFMRRGGLWGERRLYDLYQEAYTPWEWHPHLQAVADDLGLILFSSPFDISSVDHLESMRNPAYKIASFELVDLPLIRYAARTGKPLILSTGMAEEDEIAAAIDAARNAGCREWAVLKCASVYPAPVSDMHLRAIPLLQERFTCPVGLSDHTQGIDIPVAAVALGASLIEKHIKLSDRSNAIDAAFALDPDSFKSMVTAVRNVESAMGEARIGPTEREQETRAKRRSLFAVADIKQGAPFTPSNVRSIRPGAGLPPKCLEQILQSCAAVDIQRGTPLSWALVASPNQCTGHPAGSES